MLFSCRKAALIQLTANELSRLGHGEARNSCLERAFEEVHRDTCWITMASYELLWKRKTFLLRAHHLECGVPRQLL